MDHHRRDGLGRRDASRFTPRMVFGLAVMAVGLLLLLDNAGLVDARDYWRWWPVLLIAVGLAKVVEAPGGAPRGGLGLALVGALLLLSNLGLLRFRQVWPILLLLVGGSLVWRSFARPRYAGTPSGSSSTLSVFAMMGGVSRGTNTDDFQRGDATAIMGACEVDLRQASMKGSKAVFDTFTFWGGVEIRVPEDWAVENRGLALLGGIVDKTRRPSDAKKQLVLTGLAIMGGVEVKN